MSVLFEPAYGPILKQIAWYAVEDAFEDETGTCLGETSKALTRSCKDLYDATWQALAERGIFKTITCQSGADDLKEKLKVFRSVRRLVLKGGIAESDVRAMYSPASYFSLSHLKIVGTCDPLSLQERHWRKLGSIETLCSLTLENVIFESRHIASFSRLRELRLTEVILTSRPEFFTALNKISTLESIWLEDIEEQEIESLGSLSRLRQFYVEELPSSPNPALKLVCQLPTVQRVLTLPGLSSSGATASMVLKFFQLQTRQPVGLQKRIYALQDRHGQDVFRQVRRFVHPGTSKAQTKLRATILDLDFDRFLTPSQVADFLDYAVRKEDATLMDKCLDANGQFTHSHLLFAVRKLKPELVHKILRNWVTPNFFVADVTSREILEKTPFASYGCYSPLILAFALWVECISRESEEEANSALTIIYDLIHCGADVNPHSDLTLSLLHIIMQLNYPFPVEAVQYLLRKGASIEYRADDDHTVPYYLLEKIHQMDESRCTDEVLWQTKFAYLKALIKAGYSKFKNWNALLDIVKRNDISGWYDYIDSKIEALMGKGKRPVPFL